MKLTMRFALFRCGRCNRTYANPLGHVCVTRMDRRTPARSTKVAPKVSVHGICSRCGKRQGNPLTHVCTERTDFKRRLAASKRKRPAKPQHLYQSCHDEDCGRIACTAFRDGKAEGIAEGTAAGFDAGFAAGAASVSCGCGG